MESFGGHTKSPQVLRILCSLGLELEIYMYVPISRS